MSGVDIGQIPLNRGASNVITAGKKVPVSMP